MKIFAEEDFVEEFVIKIAFVRWWDNCISSIFFEIDVCLAVVATAIKYLSATALHRDALAVARTGYVK